MKKLFHSFTLVLFYILVPRFAEAATYWVRPTGTMAGCTPSATAPAADSGYKSTIQAAKGCWTSGDTIEIRAGTYTTAVNYNDWPNGTDWNNTTKIKRYQNETVIIQTTPFGVYQAGAQYISFDGLILDGGFTNGNGAGFIELKNSEVKNAVQTGIPGTSNNRYINNIVHHNGTDAGGGSPQDHGFYIGGSNNLIELNTIYSNCGAGIQFYSAAPLGNVMSNNIIRYNTVRNNATCGSSNAIVFQNPGISNSGNAIYGNLIYNASGYGLFVSDTTSPVIYNNTIYGHDVGLYITSGGTIKNNIVSRNTANIDAPSGSPTFAKNLCSANGTGCDSALTEAYDATFNDANNGIFTLKSTSKALNAGETIAGPASPFAIAVDGTARPQGPAWDVGAYETQAEAPSCPAVSPALVASYGFQGNGTDSTGNGHTATLGSGATYTASGKYGQGVLLNGTSGITVPDHDALDPCGGFTYEGWISLPDTSGDYAFIVKNPESKAYLFASITYTCGAGRPLAGYSQDPGGAAACYGTALTTATLHHLAVTYDATLPSANVKLYLNGSLATSANGTALLSATTGTLQFCTSGYSETCPSGTIVDEVRIYNYARSSAEITTDMNTPIVPSGAPVLKVSGIMKFNAGSAALKLPGGS